LEEGYLTNGYNPLTLTPSSIRKLLYNPAPLNKMIGKACLAAWSKSSGGRTGSRDPRTLGKRARPAGMEPVVAASGLGHREAVSAASGWVGDIAGATKPGVGGCATDTAGKQNATYADASLLRGVELNSGRDVLLTLDEILSSGKS
jgi:hypothetical protein